MTTAHVEKFAELVAKDPALLAKLGLDKVNADAEAASASAAAFITNAVKEAKALGLQFTDEEAHAFIAAEIKAAASGELSDSQLEAVAGGKASAGDAFGWALKAFETFTPIGRFEGLIRNVVVPLATGSSPSDVLNAKTMGLSGKIGI